MKKFVKVAFALMLVVAMTVTAFASAYAPSVSQMTFPTIKSIKGTEAKGAPVTFVKDELKIVSAQAAQVNSLFRTAYTEVKNADSFSALVPGFKDSLPEGVVESDLTVKDMFDVQPSADISNLLAKGGTITVEFKVDGVSEGDVVIALHRNAKGWDMPACEVVGYETVAVTFDNLSPVVFLTFKGVEIDANGPTSPATGDVAVASAVAAVCAALIA